MIKTALKEDQILDTIKIMYLILEIFGIYKFHQDKI